MMSDLTAHTKRYRARKQPNQAENQKNRAKTPHNPCTIRQKFVTLQPLRLTEGVAHSI